MLESNSHSPASKHSCHRSTLPSLSDLNSLFEKTQSCMSWNRDSRNCILASDGYRHGGLPGSHGFGLYGNGSSGGRKGIRLKYWPVGT